MVKLADTYDSGSYDASRAGSSPVIRTIQTVHQYGFFVMIIMCHDLHGGDQYETKSHCR